MHMKKIPLHPPLHFTVIPDLISLPSNVLIGGE